MWDVAFKRAKTDKELMIVKSTMLKVTVDIINFLNNKQSMDNAGN